MMTGIILVLSTLIVLPANAEFNNYHAKITRSQITKVKRVGDNVIEIINYNGDAVELYHGLSVKEQQGKMYRDLLCTNETNYMGKAFFKEGKNLLCVRYMACEKDLYFCKSRINRLNGEALENAIL